MNRRLGEFSTSPQSDGAVLHGSAQLVCGLAVVAVVRGDDRGGPSGGRGDAGERRRARKLSDERERRCRGLMLATHRATPRERRPGHPGHNRHVQFLSEPEREFRVLKS